MHHSCSCRLPQEGKVKRVNFHISWPGTFSSWRCHGGEENRKTVTAIWVSLEGFLSWNGLSMGSCSHSACSTEPHWHMSHSCANAQALHRKTSLCRAPHPGWFSCPCAPTPSPHPTNSSASGNLTEEALCLTERARWASSTLLCLFEVF